MLEKGACGILTLNDENFQMGKGSCALFAYVSDPDGTWIELAEVISFPDLSRNEVQPSRPSFQQAVIPVLAKLLRFAKTSI